MTVIYKRYTVLATLAFAVFIVCFGIFLLPKNRSAYRGIAEEEKASENLSGFEAELIYEQLADSFERLKSVPYEVAGYSLTTLETDILDHWKRHYKRAFRLCIVSGAVTLFAMLRLRKRRIFSPLVTGSLLAGFFVAADAVWILFSGSAGAETIRSLCLRGDRTCLGNGLLSQVLPGSYFSRLALVFVITELILIAAALLLRWLISYFGRPHRF